MGLITAGVAFISAETAGFLPVSGGFIRTYFRLRFRNVNGLQVSSGHVPMFTDKALGITARLPLRLMSAVF